MSAPEPNIEVQTRRHIGPLVGMAVAVFFAGALFLVWMLYEVDVPDEPLPEEADIPSVTEPDGQTATLPRVQN
jgi:hypothetical protein